MKTIVKALILCAAVLFLFSCTEEKEREKTDMGETTALIDLDGNIESITQQLKGDWYDINGTMVLSFEGDRIVQSYGEYRDEYPCAVEKTGSMVFIRATGEDCFGIMSDIEVRTDRLLAYDQVLDASGHSYVFVRRDAVDKEKEIVDRSKDLPKEIQSDVIESFSLSFTLEPGRNYDAGESWPSGAYSWEIEKEEGVYHMNFHISGESYIITDHSEDVTEDFVKQLDQLIRDQGVLEHNGYYMYNNVHLPPYSLYVDYEGGERIMISAGGNAADSCVFSINAFLDLADTLDLPR